MLQFDIYIERPGRDMEKAATLLAVHERDAMQQLKDMLMPVVTLTGGALMQPANLRNAYSLNFAGKYITYIIQKA